MDAAAVSTSQAPFLLLACAAGVSATAASVGLPAPEFPRFTEFDVALAGPTGDAAPNLTGIVIRGSVNICPVNLGGSGRIPPPPSLRIVGIRRGHACTMKGVVSIASTAYLPQAIRSETGIRKYSHTTSKSSSTQ